MNPDFSHYFWQGKNIRLRPLTASDAELSFENHLDSPSRQFLESETELPATLEGIRAVLEKYSECKEVNGVTIFTIETLTGDRVGGISLHSCNHQHGTFSFGIHIYRNNWKRGYATEAAVILFKYCFHQMRYQKCNSACLATNAASIQMHQKLGFKEEGRRRQVVFMDGQYIDEVLFGLTREEFDDYLKNSA